MTPSVAVVVPVKNRSHLLEELLRALRAQSFEGFEAVIVDDHSDEPIGDAFRAATEGDPRFRLIDNPGAGAVAARCAGVAATAAPILAFTDSDCVPDPLWLERGIAALEGGADVVQGRTEPERRVRPGERSVAVSRLDGLYATCNVFYRREAFDRAGGFDRTAGQRLGFRSDPSMRDLGFGEDTLLGWRVARSGRAIFDDRAVVRHHVFAADLRESLYRAWVGGGFPTLIREVPELRETFLWRRLFVADAGRVPLYAALLLALTGRRRSALIAAVAWCGYRGRQVMTTEPVRKRWPLATAHVCALDAVSAVALAIGSLRARTPVL
jgi:glycosyltransferase involved in cell wall biosynthesis